MIRGDILKITVKLFATFREGRQKIIEMELPEETTPSRIVAMSFCEPRSWTRVLSS